MFFDIGFYVITPLVLAMLALVMFSPEQIQVIGHRFFAEFDLSQKGLEQIIRDQDG